MTGRQPGSWRFSFAARQATGRIRACCFFLFSFAMSLRCGRLKCGRQLSAKGSLQPWELECTVLPRDHQPSGSAARPRRSGDAGGISRITAFFTSVMSAEGSWALIFARVVWTRKTKDAPTRRGFCAVITLRGTAVLSTRFFLFLKYGQTSGAAVQRLPCFPSGSWRPRRGVAPQCSRRTPVVPCG